MDSPSPMPLAAIDEPVPERAGPRFPRLLRVFEPAPPAETMLQDPAEIRAQYRYWQRRILYSSMIGYAMYYFVRKNLSLAMPGIGQELGIGKGDLGLFLTLHGLLYGVSKFANGFLGDRTNARTFMAAGLVFSALVNVCFGFGSAVMTLGVLWMLNGWVRSYTRAFAMKSRNCFVFIYFLSPIPRTLFEMVRPGRSTPRRRSGPRPVFCGPPRYR